MSYTGFFAGEDLYEVAKDGDPARAPGWSRVERPDDFDADVVRRADRPGHRRERAGSATRRATSSSGSRAATASSASYYTPEVLTRFVVTHSLAELLDQTTTHRPPTILDLTVCEPALGSGRVPHRGDQPARRRST